MLGYIEPDGELATAKYVIMDNHHHPEDTKCNIYARQDHGGCQFLRFLPRIFSFLIFDGYLVSLFNPGGLGTTISISGITRWVSESGVYPSLERTRTFPIRRALLRMNITSLIFSTTKPDFGIGHGAMRRGLETDGGSQEKKAEHGNFTIH